MIFYEYGSYDNLRTTIKELQGESAAYVARIVFLQNRLGELTSRNEALELENIHLKDFITERDKASESVSQSMMPVLQEIVERKNKKTK